MEHLDIGELLIKSAERLNIDSKKLEDRRNG
jgi:hypothetical protein